MRKLIARIYLFLYRWTTVRPEHELPDKCVMIAAPHTSNWDFPVTMAMAAVSDVDIKRIAVEVVRSGNVVGLNLPHLADNAFDGFVVDRLQDGQRLYLRPKVPFGA